MLTQGLHRLEYKGYDSAGVSLVKDDGVMNVYKSICEANNMESVTAEQDITGTLGIAIPVGDSKNSGMSFSNYHFNTSSSLSVSYSHI